MCLQLRRHALIWSATFPNKFHTNLIFFFNTFLLSTSFLTEHDYYLYTFHTDMVSAWGPIIHRLTHVCVAWLTHIHTLDILVPLIYLSHLRLSRLVATTAVVPSPCHPVLCNSSHPPYTWRWTLLFRLSSVLPDLSINLPFSEPSSVSHYSSIQEILQPLLNLLHSSMFITINIFKCNFVRATYLVGGGWLGTVREGSAFTTPWTT